MRLAALTLSAFLLAACSAADQEPSVDWSQVPNYQHRLIERAVTDGDCEQMQAYFDGSSTADVLDYLDWHMANAGCY